MEKKIAILNNYSDEQKSAPSASYFANSIPNSIIVNICHGEMIDNIDNYGGYIISGSRSCHKDEHDWIKYLRDLIVELYENAIPCLAVCFGHQLVADIFGGETIVNSNGEEGFQNIYTLSNGKHIELFKNLSDPTKIYQSHNDAVIKAPPNALNVIKNEICIQYYEMGSIYSIQSHPEISVSTAIKIAKRDHQNIDEILNGVTEENFQADTVLYNFYNLTNNI